MSHCKKVSRAEARETCALQKLLHCLFDEGGNGDGHTNHRVVAGANQAHHLYASWTLAIALG